MPDWIESLGYLGAFLGAFLEGEILLLAAIQAAVAGYLNFFGVLLAFGLGTLAADWTFFLAGRRTGARYIERFPRLKPRFERMEGVVFANATILLLLYRFIYGFRIVLPVLFGLSKRISLRKFAVFSFVSTLLWIGVYGTLGYFFAEWLLERIEQLQQYVPYFFLGILMVFLIGWAWNRRH